MWELEDFIGEKFFVRDNHEDPIKIGVLAGYDQHHSGSSLPIMNIDGEEFLCFSALMPYSEELEKVLTGMKSQEQWNFMVKIQHFTLANARKCRG